MRIRIDSGREAGREMALEDRLVIGRGEDCSLRVLDEGASRQHAEISSEGGGARLRDLGSSNGTFVNGRRVEESALADGDVVRVGDTEMTFLCLPEAQRETVLSPGGEQGAPDPRTKVETTLDPAAADLLGSEPSREDLEKVYRLVRDLTGELDPEPLLERFLQELVEVFSADVGVVRLAGSAAAGRGEHSYPPGARPVAERVLAERVLRCGEGVLLSHAAEAAGSESVLAVGAGSIIAAPLVSGGRALGFLYVDRRGENSLPFTVHDLGLLAEAAAAAARALAAARAHVTEVERLSRLAGGEAELVGESPAFLAVLKDARQAGESSSPVLITGPTGSGKELVARLIHRSGPRARAPFVPVNCAAVPENLIESELFGHERGAFTGASRRRAGYFEAADGGTLFLDEIGELPVSLQAKLLRALESGEFYRVGGTKPVKVDVRVLAATNRDVETSVREGSFREDLFYRLNVLRVKLPPLCERPGDVRLLCGYFLRRKRAELKKPGLEFAAGVKEVLEGYAWPGNVRELANVVERAVVLAAGTEITVAELPGDLAGGAAGGASASSVPLTLAEAEKRAVEAALAHTKWKKGEAAKLLGISWPTLNKKIGKYGLTK
ncbi:MAG: sigma 54-interacting transcriptional regulator [Planctomycetota bacterium]